MNICQFSAQNASIWGTIGMVRCLKKSYTSICNLFWDDSTFIFDRPITFDFQFGILIKHIVRYLKMNQNDTKFIVTNKCDRQWCCLKIKVNLILVRERRGIFYDNRYVWTHVFCGNTIKPKFSICSLAFNVINTLNLSWTSREWFHP